MEGLSEPLIARSQAFCTQRKADLDRAEPDRIRNILYGFQSTRAESINDARASGVGEAGCEHGCPDDVRCFRIIDLGNVISMSSLGKPYIAYIAHANIIDTLRI